MRELIRISAAVFVVLGGAIFGVCALMTVGILLNGNGMEGVGIAATIVAFGGLVSGASIVLVGGSAYLLASIDERLEGALRKSGMTTSPPSRGGSLSADELAAAQVG